MILFDLANPKGILWLASYPRSGGTWTRVFLTNLHKILGKDERELDLNRLDERFSLSDVDVSIFAEFLGRPPATATPAEIVAIRPKVLKEIVVRMNGLALLKTHSANGVIYGVRLIPYELSAGAIYVVRNPLDVVISTAKFRGISVDKAIAEIGSSGAMVRPSKQRVFTVTGNWSEHVASWTTTENPAILVLRYEDMLDQPTETFRRIATHVRMPYTPVQLASAIERSSFDRLRALEEKSGFGERPATAKRFFRDGRRDQWREMLTPAQINRVVADHRVQMARFGYLPAPSVKFSDVFQPVSQANTPPLADRGSAPVTLQRPKVVPKTLAFVLAIGRSGTHLLASILSNNRFVTTAGEVLNENRARRRPYNFNDFFVSYIAAHPDWRMTAGEADKIIEAYFEHLKSASDRPIIVVDMKEGQLRLLDWPDSRPLGEPRFISHIKKGGYPIIRPTRRDRLAQHASSRLAVASGRWYLPTSAANARTAPRKLRLRLDPKGILSELERREALDAALDQWVEGCSRVARITYETMLDGDRLSEGARHDLSELLGVELSPDAVAGTVKLAPPLRAFIENLDEVLDALENTPFAWLRDLHREG